MIRIEIKAEGGIKTIDQIYEVSRIAAMEALSKAGNRLRENSRQEMRSSRASEWIDTYKRSKDGTIKRTVKPKNTMKAFGARQSRGARNTAGTFDTPASMANFINSYLMEKNLTMVVGGKHRNFRPKLIRDGEIRGFGNRVSGVSKRTHNILEKLETGKANEDSSNKLFNNSFKGRFFMQKGRASSMSYINETMTTTLAKLIEKQMIRKQQREAS